MKAAFPQYCQILTLFTLLLIQFSEACEYCGNTPCTCVYCEICKEKPCGCAHSKEPDQTAPGQLPSPGEVASTIMSSTVGQIFDRDQRITFSPEGRVHYSNRLIVGSGAGKPLYTIEEEPGKNDKNIQDIDTAVSIILCLLQRHRSEEHFPGINKIIMSLLGGLAWVMVSEDIEDIRASHRKMLEPQGYGLCGLSALPKTLSALLENSLNKFLDSSKYSSYYIFSVQFSQSVNVSLFFHTTPDVSNVAIFFLGQFYVVSKPDFVGLVTTLLYKKETTYTFLDQIKKGASIDPDHGYIRGYK